ncbi:unnamed protein product [Victoria cruziana]
MAFGLPSTFLFINPKLPACIGTVSASTREAAFSSCQQIKMQTVDIFQIQAVPRLSCTDSSFLASKRGLDLLLSHNAQRSLTCRNSYFENIYTFPLNKPMVHLFHRKNAP